MPGIMLGSKNSTRRKLTSSSFSVSQEALTNLKPIILKSLSTLNTQVFWEKTCPVYFCEHLEFVMSYSKHIYEVC